MANFRSKKLGVSLMEIIIVAALGCVIMTVGFVMMSQSNRQFKKGNDLINVQRLMDNIVERLRTDVRSLKRVVEFNYNKFVFVVLKEEKELTITYEYSEEEKTLYRSEKDESGGVKKFDFHGSKQVPVFCFDAEFEEFGDKAFKQLNVVMQISSNEYNSKKENASHLSIACQFFSSCVESEFRINSFGKKNED